MEKIKEILINLTDKTGFDHSSIALEALSKAESDIQLEIDLAVAKREKEIKEKIKNFVIINNEFKVGAEEMRHSILNWCFKY
jgi:hypothetical protein